MCSLVLMGPLVQCEASGLYEALSTCLTPMATFMLTHVVSQLDEPVELCSTNRTFCRAARPFISGVPGLW